MLTYDIENREGPIYAHLYNCIKKDILSGALKAGTKLPSKRSFAGNNGISVITVQNAYDQLISEGFIYTLPKRGYYVSNIEGILPSEGVVEGIIDNGIGLSGADVPENGIGGSEAGIWENGIGTPKSGIRENGIGTPKSGIRENGIGILEADDRKYRISIPEADDNICDLSGNGIHSENFPFSVWAKLSRSVMSYKKDELMQISPVSGVILLREAISKHLKSFRGMSVNPGQIVVGAGTEYLYGLLIPLLGKDKIYTLENPGYSKLANIYRQLGVSCLYAPMDDKGVSLSGLWQTGCSIAHICPNHHFPTGITMPVGRRMELLSWAKESSARYIIEDDYDSEFRVSGKPIPPLYSIDSHEKVIYMNTFSKSLSPTIRISYMVLPPHLANRFYSTMSFYSCTVSNFEQYTLAAFIDQGYFEKHINRMRLFYTKKRKRIIGIIEESGLGEKCRIIENDSGLHFLIELKTDLSDEDIKDRLLEKGIRLMALSDYYFDDSGTSTHQFIINYSNLDENKVLWAFGIISGML